MFVVKPLGNHVKPIFLRVHSPDIAQPGSTRHKFLLLQIQLPSGFSGIVPIDYHDTP